MSIFRSLNPFVVLSISLLIVSGCNAFEFMYGGESDEPDVLLDDARIALQNGDAEKAIGLLEKALEKDPDNSEIKIELSSALFQANDIDLLVMKDLAAFISETPAVAPKAIASHVDACNFREDILATTILDFSQDEAFQLLYEHTDVIERAIALLQDVLDGDGITSLPDNILSNAHLMRAISNLAATVIDIDIYADLAQVTLHWLPRGGIGYCAVDQETLTQFETFVLCEKMPAIDQAVEDLVSRQSLFGDTDSDLVTAVSDARAEIAISITASCEAPL